MGLVKKPIENLSPRLQRLMIRLLRYNFKLIYVPGKKMQVADTLSRSPNNDSFCTDNLDTNLHVYSVITTSNENVQRITNETKNDATLQEIRSYIENGWPIHKSCVKNCEIKKYWSIRNELYVHDEVLFFKRRIIVPFSLRQEFLLVVHKSYQGINSC